MSTPNLQETLQTDFPLIDSSLLAALLLDHQEELNDSSLQSLRDTLTQLSSNIHANDNQETSPTSFLHSSSERDLELQMTSSSLKPESSEDNKESGDSHGTRDDTASISGYTSMSMTSISSGTGTSGLSSPLEFLSMLFPSLSTEVIDQVFQEHYGSDVCVFDTDGEMDTNFNMSAVIDQLLSLEYIQDLTERGLDEPEHENENENQWKIVKYTNGKRGQFKSAVTPTPKKPKKPVSKIAFVDIRQRQHATKPVNQSPRLRSFIADPWTRLSSISARLSDLLPPTPPGFFLSYFHAPQSTVMNSKAGWKMEGDALRNALSDLIKKRHSPNVNGTSKPNPSTLQSSIAIIRDIIVDPGSEDALAFNGEQLLELDRDAKLCIVAANGNLDKALDLIWLLKELDEAFVIGAGVAHLQPYTDGKNTQPSPQSPPLSPSSTISYPTNTDLKPVQSSPPVPPTISIKSRPPDAPNSSWTTVQRRPQKFMSPYVEFIPAYSNPTPRLKQPVRGSGNRFGKGGKGDIGELDRDLTWYRDRRKEALHQASQYWKSGSTKNKGGEIAFHYAEKARTFQEQERAKALDIARMVVNERRYKAQERDTLDLHGLTISEACAIVKEAIQAFDFSNSRQLKIITGRGKHSVDHVSVLGPAVRDMLVYEGYRVSTWDGGLIVRGR